MSDLSGRLSLVEIGDYVILTSEGADRGYVIHVPGPFSVTAALHPSLRSSLSESLGVEAPDIPHGSDFEIEQGAGSNQLEDDYHFYKLTYVAFSRVGSIESPASERRAINYRQTPAQDVPLATLRNIPHSDDSRVTAVRIYRSGGAFDLFENDANITYYRVGEVEIGDEDVEFDDDNYELEDGEIVIDVSNPLTDNSRMPPSISQIERFNDRLFGANGNELRFSDVRNLTPRWHAWPVINAITTGQRIEFCAEYRGMLLFGAADNLHRLSGTSPQTFRYDRISARGPASPHAWSVLEKAFGFVGSDGLYLTDGTVAPESVPQLKGYFNRYEVDDGFVGMLPNNASLWGIRRRHKSTGNTDIIYFVNDGNDWVRFGQGSTERIAKAIEVPDGAHIRQYASVKFDAQPLTGVIADGQRSPRLLDWVVDDETVDGVTKYTGQEGAPTEEIDWAWESQQLDWNSQGLGSEMKTFKELVIDGNADKDVTAAFYIDDQEPVEKTITANRMGGERFDYVRVRIDRRGFAMRFKIAGTGGATIRGLKVRAYV